MNWDQLRTLLWLRWRLTRNQWGRAGRINAAIVAPISGNKSRMSSTKVEPR